MASRRFTQRWRYSIWQRWVLRPARRERRAELRRLFDVIEDAWAPLRSGWFWLFHPVTFVAMRWHLHRARSAWAKGEDVFYA